MKSFEAAPLSHPVKLLEIPSIVILKIPYYNINTPKEISANLFISYHFKGINCELRTKPEGKEITGQGRSLKSEGQACSWLPQR